MKYTAAAKYLIELRKRILLALGWVVALFLGFLSIANLLYDLLADPLLRYLPQHHLIATSLTGPVFTPMKLAWVVALVTAMPFIAYQVWCFVAPALYLRERRWWWPLVAVSILLFYAGVFFTYFILFPAIFHYFSRVVPHTVTWMPDMGAYLDFAFAFVFAMGLAFELPLIVWVLVASGVMDEQKLKTARPYVIVSAFIVGMFVAPPDVFSQFLVAVPLCLLFECGVVLVKVLPQHSKPVTPKL